MCRRPMYATFLVLVLGCAAAGYAGVDLDTGLVAWWTFDEGAGNLALDASGRGNDGTLMGGFRWVPGTMDGAVELTGDGYVIIDSVDDDITSTNMTLSVWIKTTQATGQNDVIALNDSASGHPFELYVDNGRFPAAVSFFQDQ